MKKGAVWGSALYWVYYVVMTAFIIIAFVVIPSRVLDAVVQPVELDAALMEQRLFNKVTEYSPVSGFKAGVVSSDFRSSAALSISEKLFGYYVYFAPFSADPDFVYRPGVDEVFYGNRDFFVVAEPLAPLKYKKFSESRRMKKGSSDVVVQLVQVYPKKYVAK